MIKLSICLSDIPKDKISTSTKNNKKYLDVIIDSKKEIDAYGNSHTIYINQSKEERENKASRIYIGNGKEYIYNQQPTQTVQQPPVQNNYPPDDLPF